MTLTDFLLARIAEDADAARAAGIDFYSASAPAVPENVIAHIARHNPVRVGDDCEAKRQLVERHADWIYEEECRGCNCDDGGTCWLLRGLGIVYAEHPDYRDEWRV